MKHAFSAVSSLLVLSLLIGGCSPEDTPSPTEGSQEATGAAQPESAASKTVQAAAPTRPGKDKTFEAKGMYVTATSVALPRFKTMIADLKAAGGNTIVFDAKNEWGVVQYPSEVPLAKQINASKDGPIKDLKGRLAYAHEQGIHVVARIVTFQDPILAKARPELCPKDVAGGPWKELGKQIWLDPSKTEVQDYALALAKELVEMGVDEIQWDYVRFPAMGKTQNARYSFDPKREKHEIITGFVERAQKELKPMGALISADVYGIMAWAQPIDVKITGQLLEDMAKHVDVLSPMVYPSHFNNGFAGIANPADSPYLFVHKGVNLLQKKVEGTGVVVRPWLQAMPYKVSRFNAHYISEQIRAANDAKATGWLMWNAQNKYETAWAGAKAYSKRGK